MAEPPTQPPEKRAPSTVDFPPPGDAGEQPTLSGPPKDTPSFSVPSPLSTEEPVACLQSFGDYELLSELGRGGMGVVYQARERQSGRLIALKMMLGEKADLGRFIIEARAAAELSHPGIVTVHSWGEHDGHPFFTMDYVPGETLGKLLERGPLPCDRAVRYMIGMSRAVAAAHALGIVHRDLKPSNVIIDLSDQPRVLAMGAGDFDQGLLVLLHHHLEPTICEALPALGALKATRLPAEDIEHVHGSYLPPI